MNICNECAVQSKINRDITVLYDQRCTKVNGGKETKRNAAVLQSQCCCLEQREGGSIQKQFWKSHVFFSTERVNGDL